MQVFVPKETADGETRVAATPETVKLMTAADLNVHVQRGAGEAAQQAGRAGGEQQPAVRQQNAKPYTAAD